MILQQSQNKYNLTFAWEQYHGQCVTARRVTVLIPSAYSLYEGLVLAPWSNARWQQKKISTTSELPMPSFTEHIGYLRRNSFTNPVNSNVWIEVISALHTQHTLSGEITPGHIFFSLREVTKYLSQLHQGGWLDTDISSSPHTNLTRRLVTSKNLIDTSSSFRFPVLLASWNL